MSVWPALAHIAILSAAIILAVLVFLLGVLIARTSWATSVLFVSAALIVLAGAAVYVMDV